MTPSIIIQSALYNTLCGIYTDFTEAENGIVSKYPDWLSILAHFRFSLESIKLEFLPSDLDSAFKELKAFLKSIYAPLLSGYSVREELGVIIVL